MKRKGKLNWFEKHISSGVRLKMSTMIITALGLFLALQYNETIKAIFEAIFPLQGTGLVVKIIYIFVLTIVVVVLSALIERGLDGKPN